MSSPARSRAAGASTQASAGMLRSRTGVGGRSSVWTGVGSKGRSSAGNAVVTPSVLSAGQEIATPSPRERARASPRIRPRLARARGIAASTI